MFTLYSGPMSAVSLERVSLTRGHRALLSEFSLDVPVGGLVHIEGPNGSGKSSLLRMLAGLLDPASGSITILDQTHQSARREACFLWAAHLVLKANLTVEQNLRALAVLLGAQGCPDKALSRVGLSGWQDATIAELSTGQGRRVVMAALLCSTRPIWLLDEPFNALDADGQMILCACIEEARNAGTTVFVASHHGLGSLEPSVKVAL